MKEQFEVIEIKNQTMTLKVNRSGGCNSCSASNSCGTGILSNYFDHYSTFTKPKTPGVSVGDFITLEITEKELFLRAFQLYLLPLIALFFGGYVANYFHPNDEILQIFISISAFLIAIFSVKYFIK